MVGLVAGSRGFGLRVGRFHFLTQPPGAARGFGTQGGALLGPNFVPGPAFSTGRYMFTLFPGSLPRCSVAADDCEARGDHCIAVDSSDVGACYFGECGADPQSPCAARAPGATLGVLESGTNFIAPQVGVHVTSPAVLDTYQGHFVTVSTYSELDPASGDGKVWVVGREGFWGAPGLTMSPYLLFHPVSKGVLGEAQYFAGVAQGEPQFSPQPTAAVPLYTEDSLVTAHTSLGFVPELNGGVWVLLYGGQGLPALRNFYPRYIRPIVDAHFYDHQRSVVLRWAKSAWGPWSEPVDIFNPYNAGQGGFCETAYLDPNDTKNAFSCPANKTAHNDALNRTFGAGQGGVYGVALVPKYTNVSSDGGRVTLHCLMSTWNPYRVMLMKTELSSSVR